MRIVYCKNYEDLSKKAAQIVLSQVILKPNCVLGLPTGDTPLGMYENIAKENIDFSGVTTFNLDEYVGLKPTHDQSYHYFMNKNLYSKVNLKPENTFVPDGFCEDLEKAGEIYDNKIAAHGGIDLMVLGIGANGHIGFNEPAPALASGTHVVNLTQNTKEANSRFFVGESVPDKAITMGVGTILKSRKVLLLAAGTSKKDAVMQLLEGNVRTDNPSTLLLTHIDSTILIDETILK